MAIMETDVAGADDVELLHREAYAGLCERPTPAARAHAHLLYGELLRRARRRSEARAHLQLAHAWFLAVGDDGLADRAAAELLATTERARRRSPDTRAGLTPQERQVARLAAAGATNRDIGRQLFISPHTVSHHLRGVYLKLGVRSRRELAVHPTLAPQPVRRA